MDGDEFVGWIIYKDTFDAMEVLQNDGRGPRLFTDHAVALSYRGCLDVVAPITKARFLEMGGVLSESKGGVLPEGEPEPLQGRLF